MDRFTCQHGHDVNADILRMYGVPQLVINEVRTQHELGMCVDLDTDNLLRRLMKEASELQPDRYKPLP